MRFFTPLALRSEWQKRSGKRCPERSEGMTPFLSPWLWTEVKEWPFSVTLTLNRSEGMTLFCHPDPEPKWRNDPFLSPWGEAEGSPEGILRSLTLPQTLSWAKRRNDRKNAQTLAL